MGGGMTAAEKKAMIEKMQNLMTEIVKLDKELSDNQTTNLKSPGLSDGVWGSNTEESYKSILAEHNKGKSAPKDMDEALKLLGQIRVSLVDAKNRDATQKKQESAKAPAATQTNPASAITDDQAKAAFRGLLESIQSGRIKLKAGGDNSVFKQRISRDWGAIIRAYKGPQGVVDAFYGGLALTEDEKAQLVKINEDGLDGTSTVVGKINQKFLEAINTYIKPFGRALRTERGMARVIKRRQERRNSSLERLNILSKVAQRKEVARERLVKTAFVPFLVVPAAAATVLVGLGLYTSIKAALYAIEKINEYLKKNVVSKDDFESSIGLEQFKKIMGISIDKWVTDNDAVNYQIFRFGNHYNYKSAMLAYASKLKETQEQQAQKDSKRNEPIDWSPYLEDNSGDKGVAKSINPRSTPRTPPMDTGRLRELLTTAQHPPGNGAGWDTQLNTAFVNAYNEWRAFEDVEGREHPEITKGWKIVAPQLDLQPNISGAEALVGRLIALKRPAGSQTSAPETPSAATAPTATTGGPVNKKDVVSGLQYLFDKILRKEVKVDQDRFDFIRDSKNFRGVIAGLGGPGGAAEYCVNNCGFDNQEMNNIAKYNNLALDKLGGNINKSSVLAKIFNTFKNIKEQSKRPGKSGIRESVLAENVKLWLQGQGQEKGAQASISKSIEIRKMAARKKLGLQS